MASELRSSICIEGVGLNLESGKSVEDSLFLTVRTYFLTKSFRSVHGAF